MLDAKLDERIRRATNFQSSDRIPVCDFIDHDKIFHYFSPADCATLPGKIKAYHELGVDICWRFERRRDRRLDGVWSRMQRFALRRPRYSVLDKKELESEFADYRQQQQMFEPYTYLAMTAEGCLSVAYRNLGFEEFSKKMYTELIEIERLIEIYAENLYMRAQEFARQELGMLFFIKDDIAFDKGLIFSPGFLRQQWLPRIKNAIAPLKEKNIKVILHSAGNISDLIPDLIDAGIDGIHPIDREAGMDIAMIKKEFAKSLLLFGNVSLLNHSNADIHEQTRICLETISLDGGYFIGSCSGITKNVSFQGSLSFFSAIKEFTKH